MAWNFASDADDLVVPTYCEPSDRLPSPDSWSFWGITESEIFEPSKKYPVADTNLIAQEFNFDEKVACKEVNMGISGHEQKHFSSLSLSQESEENSLQRIMLSCEGSDYELSDLDGIDQMDDIFLSSLLEDLSETDNLGGQFTFPPQTECSISPPDNLTDMILELQCVPSPLYGTGNSKYLETQGGSPSAGWEKGEVATSCHNSSNSTQKYSCSLKAPEVKVPAPSEQQIIHRQVSEGTSLEESVLQELETVTAQFSETTRICFRDAFYRLAKHSKQHDLNQCKKGRLYMEKLPSVTVNEETSRFGRKGATESETNAIDRAVANLMFNKMDVSARDIPTVSNKKPRELHRSSTMVKSEADPSFPCFATLVSDAQVPICGQEDL